MPYGQNQPSLKRQLDDWRDIAGRVHMRPVEYAEAWHLAVQRCGLLNTVYCSTVWRVQIANANENDYPSSPSSSLSLSQPTFTNSLLALYHRACKSEWASERERKRKRESLYNSSSGKCWEAEKTFSGQWTEKTALNEPVNARPKDAALRVRHVYTPLCGGIRHFKMEDLWFLNRWFVSLFLYFQPSVHSIPLHRNNSSLLWLYNDYSAHYSGKRVNAKSSITWPVRLHLRLLIVQTVASVLGSNTAPLVFVCVWMLVVMLVVVCVHACVWWWWGDWQCVGPLYKAEA